MRFKTKDLLVTALPQAATNVEIAKLCLLHTHICRYPTFCASPTLCHAPSFQCTPCTLRISCLCSLHGTFGCGFGNSCGPGNSACDPTVICPGGSQDPWVIEDLEDLVTIRRELQDTVKQLDAIEKEGVPSSIKTRAEADALEASLTQALEQVRAQKKNLK
jgi:hypothetical protein